MSLSTKVIHNKSQWEALKRQAQPHSFLQGWGWGEFHERTGHQVERHAVFDGEICLAALQLIVVKARRGNFLFCPHGPLVLDHARLTMAFDVLLPTIIQIAKQHSCAFIRFSPLLLDTPNNRHMFRDRGFRNAPTHMHPELAWLLDLSSNEDVLLQQMSKTARYSIKKAQKEGVVIQSSDSVDDLDRFWEVYQATVKRQRFTPFSKEYLKVEFETLKQDDAARFFFAIYNARVISAALVIYDERCGYYHHGASIHESKVTASHLVQWHAIQEAKRRGCRLYNFWGVVREDQTNHPWAGLSLFKRSFGGFEEAYVHAQDMPLSPRYWITAAIESMRRLRRGL